MKKKYLEQLKERIIKKGKKCDVKINNNDASIDKIILPMVYDENEKDGIKKMKLELKNPKFCDFCDCDGGAAW